MTTFFRLDIVTALEQVKYSSQRKKIFYLSMHIFLYFKACRIVERATIIAPFTTRDLVSKYCMIQNSQNYRSRISRMWLEVVLYGYGIDRRLGRVDVLWRGWGEGPRVPLNLIFLPEIHFPYFYFTYRCSGQLQENSPRPPPPHHLPLLP